MALLSQDSKPCVRDQLSVFNLPATDVSTLSSRWLPIPVTTTLQHGVRHLEYHIPGTDNYLDLTDSFLYLRLICSKEAGGNLALADNVTPANNFLHSLI